MTRRYDRYISVDQASTVLKISVEQVLTMIASGELRGSTRSDNTAPTVSATDTKLIRKRLETLSHLDGDQQ